MEVFRQRDDFSLPGSHTLDVIPPLPRSLDGCFNPFRPGYFIGSTMSMPEIEVIRSQNGAN